MESDINTNLQPTNQEKNEDVSKPQKTPHKLKKKNTKKITKTRTIRMKVPANTDLPSVVTVKPQIQQRNIMSAVHSSMYKPSPPKYDISLTTFSSTVDHPKITLTFMPGLLKDIKNYMLQF
eukprot:TRINITY_DN3875_c0_g1_i14.p2 TRINITY_DN3875_c0_g1~~TRINITY_DN3875_c0_g1_i14.p2  ORF type:complete len:121 (-),score=21.19 TRINITY_DN3875_c0_g1_i14:1436-1798(-)